MVLKEFVLPTARAFDGHLRASLEALETAGNLLPHQEFVARYLHPDTPYRGLLLYHGVGSGKTRAAIAAAQAHARRGRPIWVLQPASLRKNFEDEMQKAGAEFEYTHVSHNGLTRVSLADWTRQGELNPLDGSFVIVDEVHHLTRSLGGDAGRTSVSRVLYDLIVRARRAKVLLLSGSPVINRAHELAFTVNMLHGRLSEHTVSWKRDLGPADVSAAKAALLANDRIASAVVTASSARIVVAPPGFRVVDRERGTVAKLADTVRTSHERALLASVSPFVDAQQPSCLDVTAFDALPTDRDAFDTFFALEGSDSVANASVLARRCRGVVSYHTLAGDTAPTVAVEAVPVPLSQLQWAQYVRARVKERRMEEAASRSGGDGASVHRQYSRSVSNFVFPVADGVRKWYRQELVEDVTNRDGAPPSRKRADAAYVAACAAMVDRLKRHALWRDATALARHAPKFVAILDRLSRARGPALVYSSFRKLEGAGLLAHALEARGWRRVTAHREKGAWLVSASPGPTDAPRFMMPDPGSDAGAELIRAFNSPPDKSHRVRCILLTKSGSEGLSLKGVRQVHIMEPHWNEALARQIIGRAVRLTSHTHLPHEERNVRVYRYIATFSREQRSSPEFDRVKSKDGGRTSDEHIIRLAAAKQESIDRVLQVVRTAAVDCVWNGTGRCYEPPTAFDTKPMVPPDFERDRADPQTVVTARILKVSRDPPLEPIIFAVIGDEPGCAYDAAAWSERHERILIGRIVDGQLTLLTPDARARTASARRASPTSGTRPVRRPP
jgi:hypothetical protein